jgi:thiosulfate dehydrogenase [quinone] large subunit
MVTTTRAHLDDLDRHARGAIAGTARIIVGLMWLANLHWKVPPGFGETSGGGLYKYSESVTRNSPFAPFTWFTEQVVLPNFALFGWVTILVETTVAVLLLAGYRTKLAALVGAAMTIPIMLSVLYYDRADEWSWAYLLMFAAHLLIYASDAGAHLGLDGVLRRSGAAAHRAVTIAGALAVVIGLAGLWVSRSVDVAGRTVALLGSDAGFVNDQGELVRRWELKFMWFNPLWAVLTIALGALAVAATRLPWAARAAGAGFTVLAIAVFAMQHVDYLRDDDVLQRIGTSANAAVWAVFALVILVADRAHRRSGTDRSDDAPHPTPDPDPDERIVSTS